MGLVLGLARADPPPPSTSSTPTPPLPKGADSGSATPNTSHLRAPRLVTATEPRYPPELEAEGAAGRVVLELRVESDGSVLDARVLESSGRAPFDDAALIAARNLRFEPAMRDGHPVAAKVRYTFRFQRPAPTALASVAPSPALPPSPPAPSTSNQPNAPPPRPPAADEPVELDVIGKRTPRETTRHELSAVEARKVPGTFGDALRAIETLPGVGRSPFGLGMLPVRGAAPQDTAVFVDGLFVPLAYHLVVGPSIVPTETLDKLTFYPGNFGAQHGRAIGGVVDLALRSPRKDRFGGYVQLDPLDGRFLVETPLGSKTRVLLAGRRSWLDGWLVPLMRGVGQDVSVTPIYYDYQGIVERDLSQNTTARLLVIGSDDRFARTGDSKEPDNSIAFGRVQLQLQTRLPSSGQLRAFVAYGRNDSVAGDSTYLQKQMIDMVQARLDLTTKLAPSIWFVGGLDLLHGDYRMVSEQRPDPDSTKPPEIDRYSGSIIRPAAHASLDLRVRPWLQFIGGLRVDYFEDTNRLTADPRFTARMRARDGEYSTTFKSGFGVFQQPPDPSESLRPWGTANLFAPRAVHTSVGVEQRLGQYAELSAEGFYKHIDRLVRAERDPSNDVSGVRYLNDSSGNAYGLELLFRWKLPRFYGWLAYTLSRSERREESGLPLTTFAFDQPHILSVVGSYDLGAGWELGARFRYVSGNPYTRPLGATVSYDSGHYRPVMPDDANRDRLPAFHRLDVRIEKTWKFAHWKLGTYLDVQNVYNNQTSEFVYYNYNYTRSETLRGLPILPMLGIRGEL